MAVIKEDQWNSVIKYIQQKLLATVVDRSECHGSVIDCVPAYEVRDMHEEILYSDYLVSTVNSSKKKVIKKVEGISEEVQKHFEIFWQAYPGISRFEYLGKKFEGERVLKANKQVCLKLYNDSICNAKGKPGTTHQDNVSSKFWADVMLKALKVQIETIKQESYKTGQNRMQYLKACEVYLRQKAYEGWLGQEMPEPIIPFAY